MARLPRPGSDTGAWGEILNDYLSQAHENDGTLKRNSVGANQLQNNSVDEIALATTVQAKLNAPATIDDGSITKAKFSALVQDSLDRADSALQAIPEATASVAGAIRLDGDLGGTASSPIVTKVYTKSDVGLSNVDNTADSLKPISNAVQNALNAKVSQSANLGDLTDSSAARTNLGLGDAATKSVSQIASDPAVVAVVTGLAVQPPLKATASNVNPATLPYVNVLDYGASPDDDSADNAIAINAAISAASAASAFSKQVAVRLPPRRFRIKTSIQIASNVWLYGPGSTIELDPSASVRMIVSPGASTSQTLPAQVVNVGLVGLTFDGNRRAGDPRSAASWHALFLKNVKGLTLSDVTVRYPLAFGALIDTCTDVFVRNWRVESDQINQDGIHFFDCEIVTIDGLHGTAGDDLLGISAQYADTRDFTVSDVIGSSIYGSIIRVNQTDRSVTAAESRIIERMRFRGVVGRGSGNKGFTINDVHSSSSVRYFDVEGIFTMTPRSGLDVVRATYSRFAVTCIGCGTGVGVTSQFTLHPVYIAFATNCKIEARVVGVTDGYDGIHVSTGNTLRIEPEVYYPVAGFSNAQMCVWLGSVTDSAVADGYTDGGNRGIQLGTSTTTAQRVRVQNMLIRNNSGSAVAEGPSSDANMIVGNHIKTGGVARVGSSTVVRDNLGLKTEARGTAVIPSGATSVTVTHGLTSTPATVLVSGRHAETAAVFLSGTPAGTTFVLAVASAVTADRTIDWSAQVYI